MAIDYCYVPERSIWGDPPALRESCQEYSPLQGQNDIDQWILELDSNWFGMDEADEKPLRATLEQRLAEHRDKWERQTAHMSSVDDITAHPSYREIITYGWEVVPLLLKDLRSNQGFWFPALSEITGIQPYDARDAGNGKRMTEAWLRWGTRKGII